LVWMAKLANSADDDRVSAFSFFLTRSADHYGRRTGCNILRPECSIEPNQRHSCLALPMKVIGAPAMAHW